MGQYKNKVVLQPFSVIQLLSWTSSRGLKYIYAPVLNNQQPVIYTQQRNKMKLERERSLLFDEYEHSVTKTHSQISLLRSLDKKPSTLDDSDMIPLTTEFDSQMNVGLPMPFEHLKDGYNSCLL